MSELILIVDDEPGILSTLGGILSDEGYSTLTTTSGESALSLYEEKRPSVVFLDIWLADRDGLETLQALREADPTAAVVMMSGHGTASTAVKAIKMGAYDYLEKPLSYKRAVDAAAGALEYKRTLQEGGAATVPERTRADRGEAERRFTAAPDLPLLAETRRRQRTLDHSTVVYGLGLHSGQRTAMVLQPLPANSGIHFVTLPTGVEIPAYVGAVAETDYATTLSGEGAGEGEIIRTVEHLLSALHAYGVGNLLIKVHGEIPVLDGSALEFCKILEDIGVAEQDEPQRELVIDRRYEVGGPGEKVLSIEPADEFSVSYLLRYPPPVGEQSHEFTLTSAAGYKREIAPARTFGFMKDLKMLNELGLGSGGRLDNFILVGEDDVLNTELRFPDEFVRHKILDIIGDLYLLGYPIRGKVTARLTGHRDNIALLRQIIAG
ncbi:MAG TPA: UDP-3-O-acyl-N-acetylglucosamine deacetylase [Thermoanaerobaculia bacterium]|jgi:UDP-3-O-acyl N-acetylglucosamine deacetylase|nr:UDP-3-O-acyl-N-acetylglucosamine deacetylase [Thermoanaerobaculia bacterium]